MPHDARKYLYDIYAAAERIRRFTKDASFDNYLADELLQSAVERQFEIIGEAVNQLSRRTSGIAERIPSYQRMIAFRNVLIHGYATVDPMIVWGVVESDVEELLITVDELLREFSG